MINRRLITVTPARLSGAQGAAQGRKAPKCRWDRVRPERLTSTSAERASGSIFLGSKGGRMDRYAPDRTVKRLVRRAGRYRARYQSGGCWVTSQVPFATKADANAWLASQQTDTGWAPGSTWNRRSGQSTKSCCACTSCPGRSLPDRPGRPLSGAPLVPRPNGQVREHRRRR